MMEAKAGVEGLVSILMPCCGQLEYTRLCIPRILRHSRPPIEILCMDAGSVDGTQDYLDGVAAGVVPVKIFRSADENAFGSLVQDALQAAQGEYLAWVNNDVLVPALWLDQLTALVKANPAIGMVGPMSNLASENQLVKEIDYHLKRPRFSQSSEFQTSLETQAFDAFAQSYREANRGQWADVDKLSGFCWLAKRETLKKGPFMEYGDGGIVDGARLSWRVRQLGYRLVCCRDLTVHHFGSNLVEKEAKFAN